MNVISTPLDGAYIIEMLPRRDDRGFFVRTYCQKTFAENGLRTDYVQANHSRTKGLGSVRGMHFQHPPFGEVKVVRCTRGAILDVFVDLRKGSKTFLEWFAIELSEDNFRAAYIPPGFAHGFQTLSDDVDVLYQVTAEYNPSAEGRVRYDDPRIGIRWPLPISGLSPKDAATEPLPANYSGLVC
ncbi:MAG: dTDP-4-dehydrorhamnose 3,5-epimerase [Gemmataceae bacterium]